MVEIAIYKRPAVQIAALVAQPNENWGETPYAVVQLKPGVNATTERLLPSVASNSPTSRLRNRWCAVTIASMPS